MLSEQGLVDNEDTLLKGTKFGSSLECTTFFGVQLKVGIVNICGIEFQSI